MSKSFLFLFKNLNKYDKYEFPLQLSVGIIGIFGHFCYACGTFTKTQIVVTQKYMLVRNGFTEFMIIDSQNKHYNVNNSLWYWKWNSIEDWNSIELNQILQIEFYGWRIPLFGVFPNIFSSIKYLKST
jgi:hypothetical protein